MMYPPGGTEPWFEYSMLAVFALWIVIWATTIGSFIYWAAQ